MDTKFVKLQQKKEELKMGNKIEQSFKEEAIKLALSSPQPYAKTARDLGIKENSLYAWISKYKDKVDTSNKSSSELLEENRKLQKEIYRLKEEREILKKAAKFFVNEQK